MPNDINDQLALLVQGLTLEAAAVPRNSGIYFEASEGEETSFNIVRGSDGSMSRLIFHNAVLCRAETNKNQDDIDVQGIADLAATIAGWPVDIEHNLDKNSGTFVAGRSSKDGAALLVDGMVWASRYPTYAQGILDGTYGLSIEADAQVAECSVCGKQFTNSDEYCAHLRTRLNGSAVRRLRGLTARGGAITRKPAGTATNFDQSQIYLTASHHEADSSQPEENGMDALAELQKKYDQALADLTAARAEVVTAKENLVASTDASTKKISDLTASLEQANGKLLEQRTATRRAVLGTKVTDEQWEKQKPIYASMDDAAFDLLAGVMTAPAAAQVPPDPKSGTVMVQGSASENGDGHLVLG